jgi:hypothetical protein
VTWIVVPETDAISPDTRSLPWADGAPEVGGDDDDPGVVPLALLDVVGDPVVDEPHAAIDSAVTPMTASSGYFDIAVFAMVGSLLMPCVTCETPQASAVQLGLSYLPHVRHLCHRAHLRAR